MAEIEPVDVGTQISRATTLFANGYTQVDYLCAEYPSDRLAVTFSHYGSNDLTKPGFAQDFLGRQGFDVIAVKCNENNWFQDLSTDDLSAILYKLPHYKQVITYGSSMGGYAALYFGPCLNANLIIAISPQFSIDPSVVPFEHRWAMEAQRIKFSHAPLGEALAKSSASVAVLYDPKTPDVKHVDILRSVCPALLTMELPYGGHPVGYMLQEIGLLEDTITKIIMGSPQSIRNKIRENRRVSPTYYFFLALACAEHNHFIAADSAFSRAIALSPRADIEVEYSRFLDKQGRPDEALTLLDSAMAKLPPDAHLIAFKAHLCSLLKREQEAITLFDVAINMQPNYTPFYAAERELLRKMGGASLLNHQVLQARLSKAKAQLSMRYGPKPGVFDKKLVTTLIIVPLLIAMAIAIVALQLGLN